MFACRDAVIRELKERFDVRAIAEVPPKYDSAVGEGEGANTSDCDT